MNMRSRYSDHWCILLLAILIGEQISPTRSLAQSASPVTQVQTQQIGSAPPPTDAPPPPAKQNFGGLSFGVGLGLTLNVQNTSGGDTITAFAERLGISPYRILDKLAAHLRPDHLTLQ
jgi:hypothetical protein